MPVVVTALPESLSRAERAALADLLERVGPDRPTGCAGWTTADLAAHLVVRDRRPDTAPGAVLGGPAGRWTERVRTRLRDRTPWVELVAAVRSGPPAYLPTAWPVLDRLVNTGEMAIHHEDVRRGGPDWSPRELPAAAQDELWRQVPFLARTRTRGLPGRLLVRRTDTGGTRSLGSGDPVTTVSGDPLELLLWASGRDGLARVEVVAG